MDFNLNNRVIERKTNHHKNGENTVYAKNKCVVANCNIYKIKFLVHNLLNVM